MSILSGFAAKPFKAVSLVTLAHVSLIWVITHANSLPEAHKSRFIPQAVSVRFVESRAVVSPQPETPRITKPEVTKPEVTKLAVKKAAVAKPVLTKSKIPDTDTDTDTDTHTHTHTQTHHASDDMAVGPTPALPATQAPSYLPVESLTAPGMATPADASEDIASRPAKLIGNPQPLYPSASRRFGEQGTAWVEVLILSSGRVGQAKLKKSSGFPRLDKAALTATESWTYQPAQRAGVPVDQWHTQPVTFAIN